MIQGSDEGLIARENILGLALFVVVVLGPPLALVWLVIRNAGRRLLVAIVGALPTIAVMFAGLVFSICHYPGPPGEGAEGVIGKRHGTKIVAALTTFHDREGRYPAELRELVPSALGDSTLTVFPELLKYPLEYLPAPDRSGFQLTFRYTGPGMNFCRWSDTAPSWRCGGYF